MKPAPFQGRASTGRRRSAIFTGVILGIAAFIPAGLGDDGFTASLNKARMVELGLDRLTEAEPSASSAEIQAFCVRLRSMMDY